LPTKRAIRSLERKEHARRHSGAMAPEEKAFQ
jgi:hypothetical protein